VTQKPRELDISAITAEAVGSSEKDWIFALCPIECVNNPYPLAFLTKEPAAPSIHVYDILMSGLPAHIRQKGGKRTIWSRWTRVRDYLHMEKFHHYCDGRIATQFCSFTPKKNTKPLEWMAWHEDGHFDSFNKLCAAVNYDIEDHFTNTRPALNDRINLEIFYPIVVTGGEILDVRHSPESMELESVQHIHYVQSTIARGGEKRYHIDVVTEAFFPQLISMIEKETKQLMNYKQLYDHAIFRGLQQRRRRAAVVRPFRNDFPESASYRTF
jgi:hypothetical protein